MVAMNMVAWDWIVLCLMIGGLMCLAPLIQRYVKSVAGFLVAGRKMRLWLGVSTMEASGIGLVAIANFAEQGFNHGYAYIWLQILGAALIIPLFGIIGFGIQRYRMTRVQTLPQYYEMRFSKGLRYLTGFALALGGILGMAIYPMVGSKFLVIFMGLPERLDIMGCSVQSFHLMMILLIFLALFFAFIGGMVSVVITQYIQTIFMAGSLFFVTFFVVFKAGFSNMGNSIWEHYGASGFSPFVAEGGRGYGWVWIVLFPLSKILERLSIPSQCQQMSATKDHRIVTRMALWGTLIATGRILMFVTWGVAVMSILGPHIPLGESQGEYVRRIIPQYLGQQMPRALLGLTVGGLIYAFISTNSSYLLSWSAMIVNDIIIPFKRKPFTPRGHISAVRLVMVVIAIFLFMWGVYYGLETSILEYLFLTSTIYLGAGLLSYFGLYWKRTTTVAAYAGLIMCMVVPMLHLIFQKTWPDYQGKISGEEVALYTILLASISIILVSLTSRKPTKFVDYGKKIKEWDKNKKLD
jgi:SSS family solute:Na+ symporter